MVDASTFEIECNRCMAFLTDASHDEASAWLRDHKCWTND